MEAYRIWTEWNGADTSRDPDEIHINELGYTRSLEVALDVASNFIKQHFFHTDTKLRETKIKSNYVATDFASYGKTIHVDKIEIVGIKKFFKTIK